MHPRVLVSFGLLLLWLLCAGPGRAQSAVSPTSNLPVPASQHDANSQAGSGQQNLQDSEAAKPQPPKKVWTNEDMGDLRSGPEISTIGPSKGQKGTMKTSSALTPAHDLPWYRAQIKKLQDQIPPLDAKIAELQSGIAGNTVNDPNTSSRPYSGVRAGSWPDELRQFEQKRESIVRKISALEDQARHDGINPNEIP